MNEGSPLSPHHVIKAPGATEKTLSPVGRCIYCGAEPTEIAPLTKEHIVPDGIGGDIKLPLASCPECQKETSRIERMAQKRFLGATRELIGLRSRTRASKRGRREFNFYREEIVLPEGDAMFEGTVHEGLAVFPPADSAPLSGYVEGLIAYERLENALPGIFRNGRADITEGYQVGFHVEDGASDRPFEMTCRVKGCVYLRMIAKIAHAFAVSRLGVDGFRHYLPDLIIGKEPASFSWLMGSHDAPKDDVLHRLTLFRRTALLSLPLGFVEKPLYLVSVRLFGNLGAPGYDVVVGAPISNVAA